MAFKQIWYVPAAVAVLIGVLFKIFFSGAGVYVYKSVRPTVSPYRVVITTLFWVGEKESAENAFITNVESAWDGKWLERFGGADNPEKRCGWHPCGFTPQENPFYFALPYNDLDEDGKRKKSAESIPWYQTSQHKISILKNRWIEIMYNDKKCYAQWEDVGPFHEDDFEYVFGDQAPKNTQGVGAGLDVSPAVWGCLGLSTNEETKWRFVEESEIPNGPWKEIITQSDVRW